LPAPSHAPSSPQLVRAVATQRAWGSDPPKGTGLHVPTEPVTLQLWQVPVVALEQSLLQQTPSVQWPLPHSASAVQAAALDFRPHELLMQVLGLTQSLFALQVLRQVPVVVSQV
jgi:hypothetical protein